MKPYFIKELEDCEYGMICKTIRSEYTDHLILITPWEGQNQNFAIFSDEFDKEWYFTKMEEGEEYILDTELKNYIRKEYERMEYELD